MLIKILIAAAIVVVVLVIVVATRPGKFRIVRSAMMSAPPPAVFEQVNDFRKWQVWSPWEKIDPQLQRKYEGPAEGEGAIYSWVGNKNVGEGRMTIVESRPSDLIRIKLQFIKPFAATNAAEFTFRPQGDQTSVTWSMEGTNGFAGKLFCMLMDIDKKVGGDFERGLANLKSVVEAKA